MIQTLNTVIMELLGGYLDELLGEKYTDWYIFMSWDGQIIDMDEDSVALHLRLQGSDHKDGFIHKIRGIDMIV